MIAFLGKKKYDQLKNYENNKGVDQIDQLKIKTCFWTLGISKLQQGHVLVKTTVDLS